MGREHGYITIDNDSNVTAYRSVDPVAPISLTGGGGGGSLPSWWTVVSTAGSENVEFAGAVDINPERDVSSLILRGFAGNTEHILQVFNDDGDLAVDIDNIGILDASRIVVQNPPDTGADGGSVALLPEGTVRIAPRNASVDALLVLNTSVQNIMRVRPEGSGSMLQMEPRDDGDSSIVIISHPTPVSDSIQVWDNGFNDTMFAVTATGGIKTTGDVLISPQGSFAVRIQEDGKRVFGGDHDISGNDNETFYGSGSGIEIISQAEIQSERWPQFHWGASLFTAADTVPIVANGSDEHYANIRAYDFDLANAAYRQSIYGGFDYYEVNAPVTPGGTTGIGRLTGHIVHAVSDWMSAIGYDAVTRLNASTAGSTFARGFDVASQYFGNASFGPALSIVGGSLSATTTDVSSQRVPTTVGLDVVATAAYGVDLYGIRARTSETNGVSGIARAVLAQGQTELRAMVATQVPLFVKGFTTQTADLTEWIDVNSAILSRVNKDGYFMTRKVAAPADGDLASSEVALWFDATNGAAKLKIKGKSANGTVVAGEVALA